MSKPALDSFLDQVMIGAGVLALVALGITLAASGIGPLLYGVAVGGGLAVANFAAMRWLGRRLVAAEPKTQAAYGLLFAFKLAVMLAIAGMALAWLPISTVGFAIGVSVILPAILGAQIKNALAPRPPRVAGATLSTGDSP